uniref:DUF4939 domain-containing protein n=1 Tax=Salarias fasciatus TaxID=181472 RepID=A0A672I1Z6_SALFA
MCGGYCHGQPPGLLIGRPFVCFSGGRHWSGFSEAWFQLISQMRVSCSRPYLTVSAVAPPTAPVPAPVSLVFELQPLSYPSDRSRIAYLIGLLSGPARAWGTALWENQSPACRTYQAFTEEMKRNFDHPEEIDSWSPFCLS